MNRIKKGITKPKSMETKVTNNSKKSKRETKKNSNKQKNNKNFNDVENIFKELDSKINNGAKSKNLQRSIFKGGLEAIFSTKRLLKCIDWDIFTEEQKDHEYSKSKIEKRKLLSNDFNSELDQNVQDLKENLYSDFAIIVSVLSLCDYGQAENKDYMFSNIIGQKDKIENSINVEKTIKKPNENMFLLYVVGKDNILHFNVINIKDKDDLKLLKKFFKNKIYRVQKHHARNLIVSDEQFGIREIFEVLGDKNFRLTTDFSKIKSIDGDFTEYLFNIVKKDDYNLPISEISNNYWEENKSKEEFDNIFKVSD